MQIDYDSQAKEWIAFQKNNGRPYLVYAPTLSEALSLCFSMIQENNDEK